MRPSSRLLPFSVPLATMRKFFPLKTPCSSHFHLVSRAKLFSSSLPMHYISPIPIISVFSSPLERLNPNSNPFCASSSILKLLSLWPGMYCSPVVNALQEIQPNIFERLLDSSKGNAPLQIELLMRTPMQSKMSIIYNFSRDHSLREQYRIFWNEVWMGKLLQDLDVLAGIVAIKV